MSGSNIFSISNAVRLMILIGLLAVFAVIVQSCQPFKTDLEPYATKTLKRLTVIDEVPAQPRAEYAAFDGETMRLSDYRGQVVLLNVWATWCAPCLKEMPSLSRLQELKGSPDFQVVTVSLDRTAEEPSLWLADKAITNLTPWHDKNFNLNVAVKAPGLPMTVLYDRAGREIARLPGDADWASEEAISLVEYLVSNP